MDTEHLHVAAIIAGIAILIGFLTERLICSTLSAYGTRRHLPVTHIHLIRLIARWSIIIIVALIVFSIFGIAIANLWITMSAVALATLIAFFAGWSLLSNILATFLVLIWRPFQIGDKVTILPDNLSGEARDINLFFTELRTGEGDILRIPNVTFFQKFTQVSLGNHREDGSPPTGELPESQ